ncbi:MAG: serine/threonine protein kinase [Deltaproteobacteria bacterium]|nr:serine/threonine protein kinase [Deltaproteobacteria bacterium]
MDSPPPLDAPELARLLAARPQAERGEGVAALARLRARLFGGAMHPTLERYTIERTLGAGGGGIVYLGHDPRLDRPVAIKLLREDPGAHEGSAARRHRLLREAEALARAPHPNVLAIYDVGTLPAQDGARVGFLVLEYVEGEDLRAWLSTPRSWRTVLEVFCAAGAGLAAAHRAGVVHRDFKPANAIVGRDGRVRVIDFGLARTQQERATTAPRDDLDELDSHRTSDGSLVGTPAYMAPEQHAGREADARSDQYAFCVALWEALLGGRPFVAPTLAAVARAKHRGPPATPRGTAVPARVLAALRRGLAVDPSHRFHDMEALLRALAPARAHPWLPLAAASVAIAGLVVVAASSRPRTCTLAQASPLAPAAGAARTAIAGALGTEVDDPALARVWTRIDRFDAQWHEVAARTCDAALDTTAFDRRSSCLREHRRQALAVIEVLSQPGGRAPAVALDALDALPAPQGCALLQPEQAPEPAPALAGRVAAARSELATAKAVASSGRVHEARALAETAAVTATATGFEPVIAEALLQLGSAQEGIGDYPTASDTLERAHASALACRHDVVAGKAAAMLVFVEGNRRRRLDEALAWAERATLDDERAGGSDDPSRLPSVLASALALGGRLTEARAAAAEAVARHRADLRPSDGDLGMLLNNLGDIERSIGDLSAAEEHLQRALVLFEGSYGHEHPRVAMALNNLAAVELARGDDEAARDHLQAVVALRERLLGPAHPMLATTLANLGVAQRRTGALDDARGSYGRALAIVRARGMERDPLLAGLLTGAANVEVADGRDDAALPLFDETLALFEATLGPDHQEYGRCRLNRARARARSGQVAAAQEDFDHAIAIAIAVWGRAEAQVGLDRLAFARALADAGEHQRAHALAELALAELAVDDPELRADLAAVVEGNDLAVLAETRP